MNCWKFVTLQPYLTIVLTEEALYITQLYSQFRLQPVKNYLSKILSECVFEVWLQRISLTMIVFCACGCSL